MNLASASRAINRFERAIEAHTFLGTIPILSDDPEEQELIDRTRAFIIYEHQHSRMLLLKGLLK